MLSPFKNRNLAATLALSSLLTLPAQILPGGWHLAGLHKFYLGQPIWGLVYLGLSWTPIPMVASVLEALWYLSQDSGVFEANFASQVLASRDRSTLEATQVPNIAQAVRELDQLRVDGLITEYEFEQKRRSLLERVG
jgi:TM2 domain-containing membrane protein YozV